MLTDSPSVTSSPPGFHDLVDMWVALLEGGWDSLAVVPSDHEVSVDTVVDALREALRRAGSERIQVIDARDADVAAARRLASDLSSALSRGDRAVVVVDSVMRSLSGMHLIQAVNALLLVIRLGAMDVDALSSTVTLVGPERILGAVAAPLRP